MWILTEKTLKQFWTKYPDAQGPLNAWIHEIEAARHENPAQIRARHGSADFVGDKVIFNVGGNKYRLIVRFQYATAATETKPAYNGIARVVFIGTHAEYDAIDVNAL